MKLTPIDITHKTFNKKMFGLDENEVSEFLDQVAQAMEALIHERNSLKEIAREREIQVADFKERDGVLKSTIATASQMAERLRQDGEREAKLIISDAQQKAEMVLRDSRDSLKRMYQEIADLKRTRMQFEANLRAMASAHLTLLDQGEKYMPQIGLPNVAMEADAQTTANAATTTATATLRRSTAVSPYTAG